MTGQSNWVDVSAEVLGKYQYCTKHDGRWYADVDFEIGGGCGALLDGAISKDGFVYSAPRASHPLMRWLGWR